MPSDRLVSSSGVDVTASSAMCPTGEKEEMSGSGLCGRPRIAVQVSKSGSASLG